MLNLIRCFSYNIHLEYYQYLLTLKLKKIILEYLEDYLVEKANETIINSREKEWSTIYNTQETSIDIHLKNLIEEEKYLLLRKTIKEHFESEIEYPKEEPV